MVPLEVIFQMLPSPESPTNRFPLLSIARPVGSFSPDANVNEAPLELNSTMLLL
jgi:hypothetical protein